MLLLITILVSHVLKYSLLFNELKDFNADKTASWTQSFASSVLWRYPKATKNKDFSHSLYFCSNSSYKLNPPFAFVKAFTLIRRFRIKKSQGFVQKSEFKLIFYLNSLFILLFFCFYNKSFSVNVSSKEIILFEYAFISLYGLQHLLRQNINLLVSFLAFERTFLKVIHFWSNFKKSVQLFFSFRSCMLCVFITRSV